MVWSHGKNPGELHAVCSFGPLANAWYGAGYDAVAAGADDSVPWMLWMPWMPWMPWKYGDFTG